MYKSCRKFQFTAKTHNILHLWTLVHCDDVLSEYKRISNNLADQIYNVFAGKYLLIIKNAYCAQ